MLTKCCYCLPFRASIITFSILGIIGGISLVVDGAKAISGASLYYPAPIIIFGIGCIITETLMIFGAITRNLKTIQSALGTTLLLVVISFILCGFMIDGIKRCTELEEDLISHCEVGLGVMSAIVIFSMLIHSYMWLVLLSFYQEIRH